MQYEIFHNEELMNTIEADEEFCAAYCQEIGYTYRLRAEQNEPAPTEAQVLGREITDMNLEQIAMGQEITELQLMFMEGGKAVV